MEKYKKEYILKYEKSWINNILKNIDVDSSSNYCIFELELMNKYNTQVHFTNWSL